jgi:hypothetical protein
VHAEVNPGLLGENGALKSQEDWNFLQAWRTDVLLLAGTLFVTSGSDRAYAEPHGPAWRFPMWCKDSCDIGPGWESFLPFCRKGLKGMPSTDVFDIKDLKPEVYYAVIKTAAPLADLGETLASMSPVPIDLTEKLCLLW